MKADNPEMAVYLALTDNQRAFAGSVVDAHLVRRAAEFDLAPAQAIEAASASLALWRRNQEART